MELIDSIYLLRLRNNEYFQFMTEVKNAIDVFPPKGVLGIDPVYPEFVSAYNNLNNALLVSPGKY